MCEEIRDTRDDAGRSGPPLAQSQQLDFRLDTISGTRQIGISDLENILQRSYKDVRLIHQIVNPIGCFTRDQSWKTAVLQIRKRAGRDIKDQLSHKAQKMQAEGEATILALLDSHATSLAFGHHKILFQEGDQVLHFYRLVNGTVQLSKVRINGRRQIVRLLLPGDLFGFEGGQHRRLTAECLDDTVVSRYPFEVLGLFDDGSPDLHRALMQFLRRQLFSTHEHAVMLGRQTALERVAAFLHLLTRRKNIGNGEILTLPMRRRDFADYLGLSVETVSRMLTKLKEAGLITVLKDHGKFIIRDVDSLEDVMSDAKAYGFS